MAIQPITFKASPTTPSNQPGTTSVGGIHPITFDNNQQPSKPTSTPAPASVSAPKTVATPQVGKPLNFLQQVEKTASNVANTVIKGITIALTPPSNPTPLNLPKIQAPTTTPAVPKIVATPKVGQTLQPSFETPTQNQSATLNSGKSKVDPNNPVNKSAQLIIQAVSSNMPQTSKLVSQLGDAPTITKALGDAWNTIAGSIVNEGGALKHYIDAYSNPYSSQAEKTGAKLEVIAGGAGVVFAPISALFAAGADVPIAAPTVRLINIAFSALGEGATAVSNKIVDSLPISAKAKAQIKPGLGEIAALAAQIGVGAKLGIETKDRLVDKYGLQDAQTIVEQAKTLSLQENKDLIQRVVNGKGTPEEITKYQALAKAGLVKEYTQTGHGGYLPSGLPTTEETLSTAPGSVGKNVTSVADSLTPGEHTPSDVINAVFQTKAEDTPEGKAVLKTASEAQAQGQNIMITNTEALNHPTPQTTYYRGVNPAIDPLAVSKDEAATYGKGIYLTEDKTAAKDFNDNVATINPAKQLNLYTPTEAERTKIIDLNGEKQMTYIKSLLGNQYDGFRITKPAYYGTAGTPEVVIYNPDLLKTVGQEGTVSTEGLQIMGNLRDLLYDGYADEAKALHDAYIQDGHYLPAFDEIKKQAEQIREYQVEQLSSIEKELKAEQQIAERNNPDDPTNQLLEIAGMMKKHFQAPGAKWKITGVDRVYTSVEGYSMKVGGKYSDAIDRLFDAQDIEGFKKNIKILADKFDKSFTEIYDRIKSGAIDGADYEQFKTRLHQENSNNQSILKNSIDAKNKADLAKTSSAENRESIQSGSTKGAIERNESGNINARNVENANTITNGESGSRPVGTESSNAAGSSERNVETPLPSPTEGVSPTQAQNQPVLPGGGVYKGEEDLTIPLLEKLKGKSIVSKQFIEDLTRTKDTKQAEVDIVNSVLKAFPDKVDVVKFAEALKAELLPLTRKPVEESKYERVNLPYDIKGNAVNYQENVYNSPIETKAGNVHFSGESENYFAHTRTDDLGRGDYESADSIGNRTTRRILEIQSDLFQKGRLEESVQPKLYIPGKEKPTSLNSLIAKLKPFENTWYQRIIQEEIKAAAIDGKTKLRFPTGDTAMTIEGLNKKDQWKTNEVNGVFQDKLTPENLKLGQIIYGENQGRMVVLEKTGETTFKAAPARGLEMENDPTMYQFAMDHGIIDKETGEWNMDKAFANQELMQMYNKAYGETFDVLGKADTTNPIFKFYQNDVSKYLAHYGGKEITDENGVTWNELPIKRDFMHIPVEAFGSTTLAKDFMPGAIGNKFTLEATKGTELENMPREIDWTGQEGFINVGAIDGGEIIKDIKSTLEKAKANQEDKDFGTALRTYFVGERDVRIAETNQLILTAEKLVPLPVQQEALTFLRDFKNRADELSMILDGTHPYYDAAVERFKKENPDATNKEVEKFAQALLDRGAKLNKMIEQAANPTEGMQKVDNAMNLYFKGRLEEGKKLGFLDSKVTPEEYIPHLFVPPEDVTEEKPTGKDLYAKKNKIARYFKFAKGRAYKDVVEAYLNGVSPKTLNAFDSMAIYGDQHATVAATKLLIQQLKDTELGKWGSKKSEFIPSDWRPIAPESSLFQNEIPFVTQVNKADLQGAELTKWEKMLKDGIAKEIGDQYVKADVAHQSLYAPKKVVDALMPITDGDYMNKLPLFGKSRLYQAYIKSAELSLSIFHMRAMEITAASNQGAVGFMKSQIADMYSPKFLEQEKAFIRAGGTSSILGRTIEAYSATRKTTVKTRIPTRADLMLMVPGLKQMNGFAHFLTYETFNVLQRKLKVTDFAIKDAKWLSKHGDATDAEHYAFQKAIAKEINAAYGGLQWEILGVNRMTQSVLKLLLLAPDWTFSNWFNAKTAFQGGEAGQAARAFWVRAIVIGLVLNQLWSLLMSGQLSDDPTKAYLGKDNVGKKIYTNIGFAGAPSDLVNLLKNINDYGLEAGFFKSLASKEAPLIRTATELTTNRNYLGQAIIPKGSGVLVGTTRSAVELATGLSPIPFSIQNWFKMLTDTTNKYIPAEYISILLGGGTASHTIPAGERQVTSGARKGQLVPATPPGAPRSFWDQVTSGKLTQPKRGAKSAGGAPVFNNSPTFK